MNRNLVILAAIFFICFAAFAEEESKAKEPADESSSLVPKEEYIDDFAAKRALSKVLLAKRETLPEAIELLSRLHSERPDDRLLGLELENARFSWEHPKEEPESLVERSAYIRDQEARYSLARVLAKHPKTRQEALGHYLLLLADSAFSQEKKRGATLEAVEIYLDEREYCQAIHLMKKADIPSEDLKNQLKLASLEARLGYAERSKERFQYLLFQEAESNETQDFKEFYEDFWEVYADALASWGDYYLAESIYRKEIDSGAKGRQKGVLQYAGILLAQQRYDEAEFLLQDVQECEPLQKAKILLKLIEIKTVQGDFAKALTLAHEIADEAALDVEEDSLEVQIALEVAAGLHYRLHQYEEALEAYKRLMKYPDYQGKALVGMGKSYIELGQSQAAIETLEQAKLLPSMRHAATFYLAYVKDPALVLSKSFIAYVIASSTTAQDLNLWAELYSEKGWIRPLRPLYEAAIAIDDAFLPARFGLADALSNEMDFKTALSLYPPLLEIFPDNAKLLLAQARTLSWDRQYADSIGHYGALIALNPDNPIPKLEQARVAYWAKWHHLSLLLYRKLLSDLLASCATEGLYAKVALEEAGQELIWQKRTWHALKVYSKLIEEDPGNSSWPFEYAQLLCSLGRCDLAMGIYEDILDLYPANVLTGMALERARERASPGVQPGYNYWQEIGYGELSQIGRYEGRLEVVYPLSCLQKLRLVLYRFVEHTYYDNLYHIADGEAIEWENRWHTLVFTKCNLMRRHYLHRYGTLYSGAAEMWLNLYDYALVSFGFKKADEIFNYFNLPQKTQANICWGGFQTSPLHKMQLTGLVEEMVYNDYNAQFHVGMNLQFDFTEHPNIFRANVGGDYRNTAHTNIFLYSPDGQLVNIIHPYWAPQDYYVGQIVLEWLHDYSKLQFCEAPLCYYDVKFAFGNDTQDNHFWELKLEWQHEFYRRWKIKLAALVHRSPQWNAKGLWTSLNCQF